MTLAILLYRSSPSSLALAIDAAPYCVRLLQIPPCQNKKVYYLVVNCNTLFMEDEILRLKASRVEAQDAFPLAGSLARK